MKMTTKSFPPQRRERHCSTRIPALVISLLVAAAMHTTAAAANTAPVITLQPVGRTVTKGNCASFMATANGSPTPTYQWRFNGYDVAGAIGNIYTIAKTVDGYAGTYSVAISNSVGTVVSNPAMLRLTVPNDFSGDGWADIVWQDKVTGQSSIWFMSGPLLAGSTNLPAIPVDWKIAGTADFNGDGQTDILWENAGSGDRGLWIMTGAVPVAWINLPSIALDWRIAGTGDFNGDGQPDILWENAGSGDRGLWIMTGTVPAAWINLPSIALDWRMAGTGDFNGDGQPDILWENAGSGDRGMWIMNGTVPIAWVNLPSISLDWRMAGTGDFDGDGQSDILLENASSGDRGIWIMNRTVPAIWANLPAPSPDQAVVPSDTEAARFLIQSSFGPSVDSIAHLRFQSYRGWIDDQLAMAPTYHLPYYRNRAIEFLNRSGGDDDGYLTPRQEAWWQHAVTARDQLRQRMAFALSEIFVISQDSSLEDDNEGAAAYYDLLVRQSFGNYRQLLEDVTLSPMMGTYLSMIRNQKPKSGRQPDENYAREIMQLFSIGLSELNIDGTLRLDVNSQPIPTYTQADIVGLAHVFTGWGPHFDPASPPRWSDGTIAKANDWFLYGWDPLLPMTFNTSYGDLQARQILDGTMVPATLTGPQRLKLALDTLFNHPNVGPFLANQLIQRFVTSNPSPAYVGRVASAFNNNGSGVRGDLGATLRAVLLDPEARNQQSPAEVKFGKLTEPLLRMTRLFRAFPPTPRPYAAMGDDRMFLNYVYAMDEQSPLFSPTVFNFFKPGFAKAGPIASAGLVSPEFQIFDDVTAMLETNRNYGLIYSGISVGEPVNTGTNMKLDLAEPLGILTAPGRTHVEAQAALVDYLNLRLLGGNMSSFLRQKILDTYASLPTSFTYTTANEQKRVQVGLYLVMFSPEFNIQR